MLLSLRQLLHPLRHIQIQHLHRDPTRPPTVCLPPNPSSSSSLPVSLSAVMPPPDAGRTQESRLCSAQQREIRDRSDHRLAAAASSSEYASIRSTSVKVGGKGQNIPLVPASDRND